MVEEAVSKAKAECEKFLSATYHTTGETIEALQAVLKEATMVLVATTFQASMSRQGLVMEIYSGHKSHGIFKSVLKVSLTQQGKLVKEELITCQDGCHTYAAKTSDTTLDEVLKVGVSGKVLAKNIMTFLQVKPSYDQVTPTLKN